LIALKTIKGEIMGFKIELFAQIQTNIQGYIVPGLITRVYDEQPDDADEAIDAHFFVPSDLNVPGHTVFLRGLRHAENKANPKAKKFIFYGEDLALLAPAPVDPPPVEQAVDEGSTGNVVIANPTQQGLVGQPPAEKAAVLNGSETTTIDTVAISGTSAKDKAAQKAEKQKARRAAERAAKQAEGK
jgi:hypothetical protein